MSMNIAQSQISKDEHAYRLCLGAAHRHRLPDFPTQMSIRVPWVYIGHSGCIYDVNYTTKHKNRTSSYRKQSLLPRPIWQGINRLATDFDNSKIRLRLVSCALFILYTASIQYVFHEAPGQY